MCHQRSVYCMIKLSTIKLKITVSKNNLGYIFDQLMAECFSFQCKKGANIKRAMWIISNFSQKKKLFHRFHATNFFQILIRTTFIKLKIYLESEVEPFLNNLILISNFNQNLSLHLNTI